jgi:hypothetical protein
MGLDRRAGLAFLRSPGRRTEKRRAAARSPMPDKRPETPAEYLPIAREWIRRRDEIEAVIKADEEQDVAGADQRLRQYGRRASDFPRRGPRC